MHVVDLFMHAKKNAPQRKNIPLSEDSVIRCRSSLLFQYQNMMRKASDGEDMGDQIALLYSTSEMTTNKNSICNLNITVIIVCLI